MLTGLGTGQGTWGTSNLLLTKLTTVPKPALKYRDGPVLPANMETFVQAIELLAQKRSCEVGLIGVGHGDTTFGRLSSANTMSGLDSMISNGLADFVTRR